MQPVQIYPTSWYQLEYLVTSLFVIFFLQNLGGHCSISRFGGLMSSRLRSVMRLGSYVSCRIGVWLGVPRGGFGRGHGDNGMSQQMFVADRSARALLRLTSGHLRSRGAPSCWFHSSLVCFSDTSDRRLQRCRIAAPLNVYTLPNSKFCRVAAPLNVYTLPNSKFCIQTASFGPPVQHLALSAV